MGFQNKQTLIKVITIEIQNELRLILYLIMKFILFRINSDKNQEYLILIMNNDLMYEDFHNK